MYLLITPWTKMRSGHSNKVNWFKVSDCTIWLVISWYFVFTFFLWRFIQFSNSISCHKPPHGMWNKWDFSQMRVPFDYFKDLKCISRSESNCGTSILFKRTLFKTSRVRKGNAGILQIKINLCSQPITHYIYAVQRQRCCIAFTTCRSKTSLLRGWQKNYSSLVWNLET